SSRMVGLDEFGEAAWSMEQVLNAWLAEQKPIQPPMLQLSEEALRAFGRWADDIAAGRAGGWAPRSFAESAQAMRERGEYLPLAGAAVAAGAGLGAAAEAVAADVPAKEAAPAGIPAVEAAEVEPDAVEPALSLDPEGQDAAGHAAAEPEAVADAAPAFDLDLDLDFPSGVAAADEVPLEAPLDFAETLPPVPDAGMDALPEDAPAEVPSADLAEDIDFSAFSEALAEGAAGQPAEAALPSAQDDMPLPDIPDASSPDAALQAAGMPPLADLLAEAELLPDADVPSDASEPLADLPADAWPDLSLEDEPAVAPGHALVDGAAAAEETDLPAAEAIGGPDAGLPALEEAAADASDLPTEPAQEPATADAAPLPEAVPSAEADDAVAAEPEPEPGHEPDQESLAETGADQALGAESPEEAVKVIETLRIGIPLYNVYLNEADEWSRRLVTCLQEWSLELHEPLPDTAVALAHSLAGSSATVGFQALSDMARALEHALQHVQLQPQGTSEQAHVFMAASEDIRRLLHQFAAGFLKEPHPQILADLREILESEIVPAPWEVPAGEAADARQGSPADAEAEVRAGTGPGPEVEAAPEVPAIRGHVAPALSVPLHAQDAAQAGIRAPEPVATDIDDDIDALDVIDPDLFPIFEEEAIELLPALGAALRQWAARPENLGARNEALRALHTLKGSSRLAGAMRLGEMAHRLESAVEQVDSEAPSAEAIEPLLVSFDGLQASFDALRTIGAQGLAQPVAVEPLAAEGLAAAAAGMGAEAAPAAAPRR
ncbi:Hpt domain-containing protein, partial [Paracidovorax cattleyae]